MSQAEEAVQDLRTNTAIGYEVDPHWPQRPTSVAEWGNMPGVAIDADDQVWLYNRGDDPVQVYTADGRFVRTWGRGTIGVAHYLKIDAEGNIWITDLRRHVVQKYTPEGQLLLTVGTLDEPGADERHFDKPTDVTIAPGGDLFITDGYGNNRIVHCDRHGKFIKAWGTRGVGPSQFNLPHGIAIVGDRLFVADRSNARVQVFDRSGKFLEQWTSLLVPWGFCVTKDDELWVCGSSPMLWPTDPANKLPLGCPPKDQVFMRFTVDGRLRQLWTVPKAADGQERPGEGNWVHGIAFDSRGDLYVGDIIGKRAQKFVRKAP